MDTALFVIAIAVVLCVKPIRKGFLIGLAIVMPFVLIVLLLRGCAALVGI